MKQTWIAVVAVIVIIVAIVIILKTVHKSKPAAGGTEETINAPPQEYERMMQGQPPAEATPGGQGTAPPPAEQTQ